MAEMTSERISGFIESLNEEQKEVYEYLSEYLYSKGAESGTSDERTVFSEPPFFDMESNLEDNEDFKKAYDEGAKEAMYYAGLTGALVASGISMEVIEASIMNLIVLRNKGEVDKNAILEEEATKF